MSGTIVIHAALAGPLLPLWQPRLLEALPYARRLELGRRDATARRDSLAALALALLALERLTGRMPAPGELSCPAEGGKPALPGGPRFSWSHCGTRVACIASLHADPGLDLETLPRAAAADVLLRLRHWTATEAVLKAAGLGLRDAAQVSLATDLGSGAVGDGRYFLHALELPGCVGHIAARVPLLPAPAEELDLAGEAVSAALERSLRLAPQFQ
jgi:4'-phosphopantetheinyl transferase